MPAAARRCLGTAQALPAAKHACMRQAGACMRVARGGRPVGGWPAPGPGAAGSRQFEPRPTAGSSAGAPAPIARPWGPIGPGQQHMQGWEGQGRGWAGHSPCRAALRVPGRGGRPCMRRPRPWSPRRRRAPGPRRRGESGRRGRGGCPRLGRPPPPARPRIVAVAAGDRRWGRRGPGGARRGRSRAGRLWGAGPGPATRPDRGPHSPWRLRGGGAGGGGAPIARREFTRRVGRGPRFAFPPRPGLRGGGPRRGPGPRAAPSRVVSLLESPPALARTWAGCARGGECVEAGERWVWSGMRTGGAGHQLIKPGASTQAIDLAPRGGDAHSPQPRDAPNLGRAIQSKATARAARARPITHLPPAGAPRERLVLPP